jgi:hypothetical protein
MPPKSRTRLAGASLLALATASCATSAPNVNVEADWRDSIGNLGLFALYPLAEDVQPGDVYLYAPRQRRATNAAAAPSNDRSELARFDLTRVSSLSRTHLLPHLKAQQDARLVFAPAPEAPKPAEAEKTEKKDEKKDDKPAPRATPRTPAPRTPAPRTPDVGHADDDAAAPRMRRVAMPGFTAARLTQAQIGGGGTSGNLDFSAAFGGGSKIAVSVTLGDVEELSIDAGRARRMEWLHGPIALFRDMRPEMLLDYIQDADGDLLAPFCRAEWANLPGEKIAFIVANQVLYAHNIQYNFHDESGFAATMTAAIKAAAAAAGAAADAAKDAKQDPKPDAAAPAPATPPAAAATPPAPAKRDPPSASANTAEALARVASQLTDQVKALEGLAPKTPGVTAKFGIGRLGTSTLEFAYRRPMAVGIGAPRSLTIQEVVTAHANIARGTYDLTDLNAGGAPDPGQVAIEQQIKDLRWPMKRSFEAMILTCDAILAQPGNQGTTAKLAALIKQDVDAKGQQTPNAPTPRPAPGPSVRSLLRTTR